ncbi:MAG: RHS repeat domain-containing protein, partial [Lachnospiraceae bacterium]
MNDAENGISVYEIPAAYMTDAAGAYSDAVVMEISESEAGNWNLRITADVEWVNAEDRVFPVQIDPTVYRVLKDTGQLVRGGYVCQGIPTNNGCMNKGTLMVGYDARVAEKLMRTYIQMKNLPVLPENSVICAAMYYSWIDVFAEYECPELTVAAKRVTGWTTWTEHYNWEYQPTVDETVLDYQKITSSQAQTYVGWNITEVIKAHYKKGNTPERIAAFRLQAYDESTNALNDKKWAVAGLRLRCLDGAEPILQIVYRDTKGLEDYYTYQTQNIGNAGVGYISDYTSQLTLVRPIASYESTIMPYSLNLVYNSAYAKQYFTESTASDPAKIHTKNYANMRLGNGWKLSAQETVIPVKETNNGAYTEYLVYNDSDGTEHYFNQKSTGSTIYEDEDGLNLTIVRDTTKNTYTMRDKKDNVKIFTKGYLTTIKDANGNEVGIVYNNSSYSSNQVNETGGNRITSIVSKPRGGAEETIFRLEYNSSNFLTKVTEVHGNSYQIGYITNNNGRYHLQKISSFDGLNYVETARYGYWDGHQGLGYVFDVDADVGMHYQYEKSATGYRVCYFHEYAEDANNDHLIGAKVKSTADALRKTEYTDAGQDRTFGTADDIITTCLFNSSGQTINVSSKDKAGNLLGVTAEAYKKNSGTSKTNNRVSSSISSGQAGVNLLTNGGFEYYNVSGESSTAAGWSHMTSGGAAACRQECPYSGKSHYNIFNEDVNRTQKIYQDVSLSANQIYTASAYVNTSGYADIAEDGGAYLMVADSSGKEIARSTVISYKTNTMVDQGWQQAWGILRADDVQLEAGGAPSGFNHVQNGSFEQGTNYWSFSHADSAVLSTAQKQHGTKSMKVTGNPQKAVLMKQTIRLNKSSDTTFLLSGWSSGYSVTDLKEDISKETATNQLAYRYWGILLKLNYSDGTNEFQDLPFCESIKGQWQYAAKAITPRSSGKTISTVDIFLCYYRNANISYFDNISLIEEPAQTYLYDSKGNLTCVKSGGKGGEDYSYENTTQNLMKVVTQGSGNYTYEYKNTNNAHLPTAVTNDTVTMRITYDQCGQSKKTELTNSTDAWKITSSASYKDGLLQQVTDSDGVVTSYSYDNRRHLQKVTDDSGDEIYFFYDTVSERPILTYQSGKISLDYTYTNGNLGTLSRGGYINSGGTKQMQNYQFTYDDFGNRLSVILGSNHKLAEYTYGDSNGNLKQVRYGYGENGSNPIAVVDYAYDKLDRITQISYHDGSNTLSAKYGYLYSLDGELSGVTENDELKYSYDYDSLGRLIHSSKLEDGKVILYSDHQYDTSDRIVSQSWQIGDDAFSESYTYRKKDGTILYMTTGSDKLTFFFNNLKQYTGRTSPKLDMMYYYQPLDRTQKINSNRISSVLYHKPGTTEDLLPYLTYTYDREGNIIMLQSGVSTAAEYTYDHQNQLLTEKLARQTTSHSYDTYGNIRSKTIDYNGQSWNSYSFEYTNANWLDQLTKVTFTDSEGNTRSESLTYDGIGNPLEYFNGKKNWTFTWKNIRQLATAVSGDITITNTYDVDGLRESKIVDGVEHKYVTLNGKIVRETYGTTTIDYFYDNEDRPYKMSAKKDGKT